MSLVAAPSSVGRTTSLSLRVIAICAALAVLYWARVFFITSIVAVMLAFILEPFVALLMRARAPRALASFLVCAVALLGLYLVGLGAYTQVAGLLDDLPKYSARIGEIVDSVRQRIQATENSMYQLVVPARQREAEQRKAREDQQKAEKARKSRRKAPEPDAAPLPPVIPEVRIYEERTLIWDYLSTRWDSFYQIVLMASFVPFLIYFMLSWRDHMHRSFLHFFQGEDRMIANKSLQGIADLVRAFVVGNFVLGIFLASASSLAFWAIRLPYPLLVGPLSGFLSLLPYIGLPLALLPPVLVALPVFHSFGSYVLILAITAGLHLVALNLLYPKIVGARVHLNPLVVTFALMLFGFLWDAAGLLLAIPLTAAIKAVCDNVKDLRPYGKFLGD